MACGRILQVLADMGEQLALPGAWTSGIDQFAAAPRKDFLAEAQRIPAIGCELPN